MTKLTTKSMTLCGMLSALVCAATIAIVIPTPVTGGYINLGDGVILATAYLFGGYYAAIAGGLGSCLADIFSGYAHWAPFTLIIKGLMGFVAAKIMKNVLPPHNIINILGAAAAEIIMIGGYFLAGALFLSSFIVSLGSVPENCVQAVGGLLIFLLLSFTLKKVTKSFLLKDRQ